MLIVGMINRYKEWKPDKEDELYREMCRVVGKVVLEMRDLGQEPKHIVIAGVLRTALANKRIQRSELEKQAMETVINALVMTIQDEAVSFILILLVQLRSS